MGNQQARRASDEQVVRRGGRGVRVVGAVAGCRVSCGLRQKTDRLVAWREDRSSRQVF